MNYKKKFFQMVYMIAKVFNACVVLDEAQEKFGIHLQIAGHHQPLQLTCQQN